MAIVPVIIFGDYIAAYGVIRALGPRHIPIYIVSQSGNGLCIHSRYVKKVLSLPANDADFINKLKDWISLNIGAEAVLMVAGEDDYLDILSQHHDSLEPKLKCTFPPWDIVRKVRNKRETYKIAENFGIPIPQTYFIESEGQLKEILSNTLNMMRYPLLMKSEQSKKFLVKYGTKGVISNNKKEVFENYDRYDGFMGELLLQEMIPGGENQLLNFIGIYNKKSDPIQIFMNRKRRSSGQFLSCTLMESMWSEDILYYSNRLIREIGYFGYANPEFKYDERDGSIKLMEINGRISMSNSHALRCGLNIIHTLYREVLEGPLKPQEVFEKNYQDHVLWWAPINDLFVAIKMFKNNTLRYGEYLKSIRGAGYILEPITLRDPMVFLFWLSSLLKKTFIKITRNIRRVY
jgi:D-aspartate ligase